MAITTSSEDRGLIESQNARRTAGLSSDEDHDTDTQKQDQVMSLEHTLQDQHVPGVTDQTTLHTK